MAAMAPATPSGINRWGTRGISPWEGIGGDGNFLLDPWRGAQNSLGITGCFYSQRNPKTVVVRAGAARVDGLAGAAASKILSTERVEAARDYGAALRPQRRVGDGGEGKIGGGKGKADASADPVAGFELGGGSEGERILRMANGRLGGRSGESAESLDNANDGASIFPSPLSSSSEFHEVTAAFVYPEIVDNGPGYVANCADFQGRAASRQEDQINGEAVNGGKKKKEKRAWVGPVRRKKGPVEEAWTAQFSQEKEIQMLTGLIRISYGDSVAPLLDPWVGKVTRVELSNVIKGLGKRGKAHTALAVFEWMEGQQRRLKPNGHAHSLMLGILGRANMVGAAMKLFAKMESLDFVDKVHGYNSLAGVYCRQGWYDKALALLDTMIVKGCRPDVVTFNTLISGSATAGLPPTTALDLLDRMAEEGITPNVRTLNAALAVLSRGQLCDEAMKLFEEMQQKCVSPDTVTYNTLISLYGRVGRLEDAVKMFESAQSSGVPLNEVSYTAMMDAYNQDGKHGEAIATFAAMEAAGLKPDRTSFSLLMAVYKQVGMVEEAQQVLNRMRALGIRPNVIVYSALIQAYGRQGMFEEASRVFREMQAEGCPADVTVYNILMAAYAQEGLSVQAANLFQRMQKQGLVPNVVSYNTLIRGHLKAGQLEEAKATFAQMVKAGCVSDDVTRSLMMLTYSTLGQYQKARKMRKGGGDRSTEGAAAGGEKKGGVMKPKGQTQARLDEITHKEKVWDGSRVVEATNSLGFDFAVRSTKNIDFKDSGSSLEMDGWTRIAGVGESKGSIGNNSQSSNRSAPRRPLPKDLRSPNALPEVEDDSRAQLKVLKQGS